MWALLLVLLNIIIGMLCGPADRKYKFYSHPLSLLVEKLRLIIFKVLVKIVWRKITTERPGHGSVTCLLPVAFSDSSPTFDSSPVPRGMQQRLSHYTLA